MANLIEDSLHAPNSNENSTYIYIVYTIYKYLMLKEKFASIHIPCKKSFKSLKVHGFKFVKF